MIQLGDTTLDLSDPLTLAALIGAVVLILLVLLLVVLIVRSGRASQTNAELTRQLAGIGQAVQILGQGQDQLSGGLRTVSDTQTSGQSRMMQAMETRLSEVQRQMQDRLHENAMRQARSLAELNERMNETLTGSTVKTTKSLTELQERLATIDKAQANIEKLSGNVLSLQDILSNKQTRGAFGEIQLNDIVGKALPADSYSMQATLSNGRRADCLIHLPNPPGPIVIDSKFPLEAYEALRQAGTPQQTTEAARALRTAVRAHIKVLPSEAVYAELHANFPDVVREGFAARVWIVSPTTCMATLNTMRAILKDARMREQAGAIRKELSLLFADVNRLGDRVENLDRHFHQAAKDISDIKISAEKAGNRAKRLDNFDFEELAPDADTASIVRLPKT